MSEMRTGADWAKHYDVIIHGPDGWRDGSAWGYCSLSDMITEREFWERVALSTCSIPEKAKKRFQEVLGLDDKLTLQEGTEVVRERTADEKAHAFRTRHFANLLSGGKAKLAPLPVLTLEQAEAWYEHFKKTYPQLFGMPPAAQEVSEDAAYAAWDNRPDIPDEPPLKDAFVQGYKQCLTDWVNKA